MGDSYPWIMRLSSPRNGRTQDPPQDTFVLFGKSLKFWTAVLFIKCSILIIGRKKMREMGHCLWWQLNSVSLSCLETRRNAWLSPPSSLRTRLILGWGGVSACSFSSPDYPGQHQCPRALSNQDWTSWLTSTLNSKVLLCKGKQRSPWQCFRASLSSEN